MVKFEFATANRIVFGAGALREVAPAARAFGQRALLVCGRSMERVAGLRQALTDQGVGCLPFSVTGEPTTALVAEGVARARAEQCELVIGMGGGSVIDAAKAVAVMLTNPGDLADYLEVIGLGQPLARPSAPCLAIPTTAGTGSEVTKNAVLASPEHRLKVSLRSPSMLPRLAVVDPELTCSLPATITAATGMDALTQLIEPFVSSRANPLTDGYCLEGMKRVARSLRRVCGRGDDLAAREDMALASLMGGLALANAGLGAAHGFAAPIGGRFAAPHGAVCAALLPEVMAVNFRALSERSPDSEVLRRFETVARVLCGHRGARTEDGVAWVRTLCADLKIPSLRHYGVAAKDLEALVDQGAKASSMKANPILLTREELREVLERAL